MKDINKSLKIWLEDLEKFELTSYEKLPDIDLYMDQVITYLEKQLAIFQISSLDKQITSSMINNYVKGSVIPSPESKRYSKEHIAQILEVCLLKKALSISDIKTILDSTYQNTSFLETYNQFAKDSSEIMHDIAKVSQNELEKIDTNDQMALLNLALKLSLTANANMLIAERILEYIKIQNDLKKEV